MQDRIAEAWESERRAVATRRRPITGVSEFPDVAEAAVTRAPAPSRDADHGDDAEPLPLRRLASDFERLRDTAEAADRRPTVFLANLGPGAEHSTRSTWAKNFFEAGGIAAIGNDGFADDESLVAAVEESGAELAVLCSSDRVYADRAVAAAQALADSGLQKLYLAGNPGDSRAAYEAAGVDDFVFIGCDVVDTLEGALSALVLSISGGAA